MNTVGICWGDWRLVGGYMDTCFCALKDEDLWDEAQFHGNVITSCDGAGGAIETTDNFTAKPCFYYSGGAHMKLGIVIISFLTIASVFACYGILKDIRHWNQYGLGARGEEDESDVRDGRQS